MDPRYGIRNIDLIKPFQHEAEYGYLLQCDISLLGDKPNSRENKCIQYDIK